VNIPHKKRVFVHGNESQICHNSLHKETSNKPINTLEAIMYTILIFAVIALALFAGFGSLLAQYVASANDKESESRQKMG